MLQGMRMKNKQNVAWSTFRYFVLAFLLCLSVVPLRGQPDAAVLSSPSADSLIIFSYPSRIRMFKTEYADNRLSLWKLRNGCAPFVNVRTPSTCRAIPAVGTMKSRICVPPTGVPTI